MWVFVQTAVRFSLPALPYCSHFFFSAKAKGSKTTSGKAIIFPPASLRLPLSLFLYLFPSLSGENAKLYRRPKLWSHLAGAVFRSKSFLTSDPSSANKRGLHSDTSPVRIFSLFVCVGDNQSAPTARYFTVIDAARCCFDLVRWIPSMFSVVTVSAGR